MRGAIRKEINELIEDEIEESILDSVSSKIDEIEQEFVRIRDLLDKVDLNNLDNISDAFDIADSMADKLY